MKILALDIATKTGWATDTSSGVWDFTPKRGESAGMREVRFGARIREMVALEEIKVIVYERPAGKFKSSIMTASQMIGVLIEYCESKEIQYASYSAMEIKKLWTGKGNANKEAMISEAKNRYPEINIIDDNHADALALLELAMSDLI